MRMQCIDFQWFGHCCCQCCPVGEVGSWDLGEMRFWGGSRNLVGIPIQHSDSEEEEFFVYDSMQIRPEKFDFGIE